MIRCYQRCKYSSHDLIKINFFFQKTRKYEKLITRIFELANFDSQIETSNSQISTRNSQLAHYNSHLANFNSQLATHKINSHSTTRNSQRTSQSFKENQPMHRRRNFLKEKINEYSRKLLKWLLVYLHTINRHLFCF